MRYLSAENPYIITRFAVGDTVTIDIYDLADNSKDVDEASMTEIVSTGYFKYQFDPDISTLKEYLYIADNGTEEHAGKIILGGYPDNLDATISSRANENPPSQTLNDYKATGFAVPNEYDAILSTIVGDVAGLDGDAMRGSDGVPTNPLLTNDARLDNLTDIAYLLKIIKNKKELKKISNVWYLVIYDDDDVTPILIKAMKDKEGNNITDLAVGILAQELANSV